MKYCFAPFSWDSSKRKPITPFGSGSGLKFVIVNDETKKSPWEDKRCAQFRNFRDLVGKLQWLHVPERCSLLRMRENLSDFLKSIVSWEPSNRKSTMEDSDPYRLIKEFSGSIYPEYLSRPANSDLLNDKVCNHLETAQGMKVSKQIFNDTLTKQDSTLGISRFVMRAESIVDMFQSFSKKGVAVQTLSPNLSRMVEGTRKEYDWLTETWGSDSSIFDERKMKERYEILGTKEDPIYAWPCFVDGEHQTGPHILGNLITRFTNLVTICRNQEEKKIDIDSKLCKLYEYDDDYKFGGTLRLDKNGEELYDGIVLVRYKTGPGRISFLYKVKKEEIGLVMDSFQDIVEDSKKIMVADLRMLIDETRAKAVEILSDDKVQQALGGTEKGTIWQKLSTSFESYEPRSELSKYDHLVQEMPAMQEELCYAARGTHSRTGE